MSRFAVPRVPCRQQGLVEQGVLTARMDIQAVAFDVNGTLVRILTEDGMEQIFRSAAHFLTYQGIDLNRHQVRDLYFRIMEEQQRASPEEHPEFDAVAIWRSIIDAHMTDFTRACRSRNSNRCHGF
jgi:putative hydrolase of the HAD superfamily